MDTCRPNAPFMDGSSHRVRCGIGVVLICLGLGLAAQALTDRRPSAGELAESNCSAARREAQVAQLDEVQAGHAVAGVAVGSQQVWQASISELSEVDINLLVRSDRRFSADPGEPVTVRLGVRHAGTG
jgi:hypothetical protein